MEKKFYIFHSKLRYFNANLKTLVFNIMSEKKETSKRRKFVEIVQGEGMKEAVQYYFQNCTEPLTKEIVEYWKIRNAQKNNELKKFFSSLEKEDVFCVEAALLLVKMFASSLETWIDSVKFVNSIVNSLNHCIFNVKNLDSEKSKAGVKRIAKSYCENIFEKANIQTVDNGSKLNMYLDQVSLLCLDESLENSIEISNLLSDEVAKHLEELDVACNGNSIFFTRYSKKMWKWLLNDRLKLLEIITKKDEEIENNKKFFDTEKVVLKKEINNLEKLNSNLQTSFDKSKDEYARLNVDNLNLKKEIAELQDALAEKNSLLVEKDEIIAQRDHSLDVARGARDDRFKELVSNQQKRLRAYYDDFKSAESMPMTIDLGECFRGHLESVFEIVYNEKK